MPLEEILEVPDQEVDLNLVELNDALDKLRSFNERQHQIVELRYFAGLTNEEIARSLEVSTMTVKRDWRMAKAWLHKELVGNS